MSVTSTGDVQRRLDRIHERARSGDDEAAHSLQELLWRDVLGAIAHHDCDDPAALADAALGALAIDFHRWSA